MPRSVPSEDPAPFAAPSAPEDPAPFAAPSAPETGAAGTAPVSDGPRDAETTFGLFLRKLRKIPKSGVLYALCRDLEPSDEGGKLVLTTDIRTVADTLGSERHRTAMAEVLGELGVTDFEVRFASASRAEEKDGVEQLKKDFAGYPVDIK